MVSSIVRLAVQIDRYINCLAYPDGDIGIYLSTGWWTDHVSCHVTHLLQWEKETRGYKCRWNCLLCLCRAWILLPVLHEIQYAVPAEYHSLPGGAIRILHSLGRDKLDWKVSMAEYGKVLWIVSISGQWDVRCDGVVQNSESERCMIIPRLCRGFRKSILWWVF